MNFRHTTPAHWFILRHLEALWSGTHPFLDSDLSHDDKSYEGEIFPEIAKAMSNAMTENLPGLAAGTIVAFLIVMLEQITIPEADLPKVVEWLKRIHSQKLTESIGAASKENLQSLIDSLSPSPN
jgi:hypothetical protein